MKLHLGCGAHIIEGWINVDGGLGARLSKVPLFRAVNKRLRLIRHDWSPNIFVHNLNRRFPWGDASAEYIYSAQMLEHMTKDEGRRFLRECYRVLKDGGVVRIVVPDLRRAVRLYREGAIKADDFVESLGVLYEFHMHSKLARPLLPYISFPHKCMYDADALVGALGEAGFTAREMKPHESAIPDIRAIEIDSRIDRFLIVEAVKEREG